MTKEEELLTNGADPALSKPSGNWKSSLIEAIVEMKRPYFIVPLLFVGGFTWMANSRWENLVYLVLRGMALAVILSFIIKRLDFMGITRRLTRWGWTGPALALETAMAELPAQLEKWKRSK